MIGLKTLQAQAGRQLPLMLPIVANSWLLNRWQTNQGSAGENSFFNFVFADKKIQGGDIIGD